MTRALGVAAFVLAASVSLSARQEQRAPWTASKITGSPEPPAPYRLDRVFPKLKFDRPLEIVPVPGGDRIAVIEHHDGHLGRIFTFRNDPACEKADSFLDLPKDLRGWEKTADCKGVGAAYGMAFHPAFEKNRFVFVCYVLEHRVSGKSLPLGSRVSRFTVSRTDPPRAEPESEQVLLEWPEGGHNGCCLRFGPDGFLYVSTGDGTAPNPPDALQTGQDLSDLMSSILRIDVDRSENGKPYAIPPDNPFIATRGARPENWAYGFRNPWRMDFDPATGNLWVGDVGWERWEMIFRVVRGGNYGWSIMEGPNPVNLAGKRGPTPILPAALAIEHPEAASITGGRIYRGKALPALKGRYVFADFEMFRVFAARCDGDTLSERQELARTEERVVAFAEDRDGELLLLDYLGGGIHRLVPNDRGSYNPEFPKKLSQTGLLAPGVYPYSIHAPQWLDHAVGQRFVGVPGTGSVVSQGARVTPPKDMVLAKTLSLDRRNIETQILHYDGRDWQGYTYAWDEEQKDAVLVGPAGAEKTIGGRSWTFPSRAACAGCHTVSWARSLASFSDAQIVRADLDRLRALGIITGPPILAPEESKPFVDPRDASADLDARARSYLHVNCAVCHRPGGGTSSMLDLRRDRPLEKTFTLDAAPAFGTFGIPRPAIIAGGDPTRSVLFYRMAKLGHGRMPHVGSSVVDEQGLALIGKWIESLPETEKPAPSLIMTSGPPGTNDWLRTMRAIDRGEISGDARLSMIRTAISAPDEVRGLFERFVPEDQRPKRLGTKIEPRMILELKGDAERGRRLFFESTGLQCRSCHAIGGRGESYGPDLSRIASKLTREKILEGILEPSKEIDPKFAGVIVQTDQGAVYTGILVEKTEEVVVLRDAQKAEIRLRAASVKQMAVQKTSIMPEFLLQSLTASEAADLIEFLSSQR
jgi:putative heme-binding domain-containing protein